MRIIKLAFISFLLFFLLITGFSLFIPSHIRISKAIDIRASRDSIFYLIKNKEQWPRWHPAFQTDTFTTNSPNTLQMKTRQENDSVFSVQMQQKKSIAINNTWQLHHFPNSTATTLQWYIDFNLSWYPWQKFSSLFYEDVYGKMMESGLANIKTLTEREGIN